MWMEPRCTGLQEETCLHQLVRITLPFNSHVQQGAGDGGPGIDASPGPQWLLNLGWWAGSTWQGAATRRARASSRGGLPAAGASSAHLPTHPVAPFQHSTSLTSGSLSSASRRHLLRMSPTAGPPSTRTISAVLPPSSDTGSTCVTRVVNCRMCPASWDAPWQVELLQCSEAGLEVLMLRTTRDGLV